MVGRNVALCVVIASVGLLTGSVGAAEGTLSGVQVVAWIKYADVDQEWAHVKQILEEQGAEVIESATEDPGELSGSLSRAKVFLIPEQEEAWDEDLAKVGAALAPALTEFLTRGGGIVSLEHAAGGSDLLRGAGLTAANDDVAVASQTPSLEVRMPEDPLVQNPYKIPARFEAPNGTTDFNDVDPDAEVLVVTLLTGKPVVFKLKRYEGQLVFLGFDFYQYTEATKGLLINTVVNLPLEHKVSYDGAGRLSRLATTYAYVMELSYYCRETRARESESIWLGSCGWV